jgi:hypothetical protein
MHHYLQVEELKEARDLKAVDVKELKSSSNDRSCNKFFAL